MELKSGLQRYCLQNTLSAKEILPSYYTTLLCLPVKQEITVFVGSLMKIFKGLSSVATREFNRCNIKNY